MHALEEHVTNQWYGVARNNLANIYIYLKEMKDGTGGNHNKNNDNRITDVLATESYTCFDWMDSGGIFAIFKQKLPTGSINLSPFDTMSIYRNAPIIYNQ